MKLGRGEDRAERKRARGCEDGRASRLRVSLLLGLMGPRHLDSGGQQPNQGCILCSSSFDGIPWYDNAARHKKCGMRPGSRCIVVG